MEDQLSHYEVGKVYEKVNIMDIGDSYVVTQIKTLKNGDVWVYFKGVSGSISTRKQSFMLGSRFDKDSILSNDQS